MTTKGKLATLELIGGLFGWGWIIAGLVSAYYFVMAIAFDGAWSNFGIAVGVALVSKWLAKGFNDNKIRVAFEADAMARGMSAEEAGKAWLEAYNGKRCSRRLVRSSLNPARNIAPAPLFFATDS